MVTSNVTSVILDAMVILVFLFSVVYSYKRGFLRTLLSVISFFVSWFVAGFLGRFLAQWVFDTFLRQPIQTNIAGLIQQGLTQGGIPEATQQLTQAVPDWLAKIFLSGQSASDAVGGLLAQQNVQSAAASITSQVVRPAAVILLSVFIFAVLFFICRLLFRCLYRLIGVFDRMPVIGTLNGLLGGVLGIVRGGMYLVLLGIVAWLIILLTGNSLTWLNATSINDSCLFYLFYRLNPLTW